jgi:uncharacterized membrane protein YeaQ/YmgE (transglycosylase-associated protein family)
MPNRATKTESERFGRAGLAGEVPAQGYLEKERTMSFLAWIVLGLIAGWIGSMLVNKSGEGVLMDIVLGVIGAVLGGWLFNTFGHPGVTGLNLYSLLVAVVGAVVVLFLYHLVVRSSRTTTITRP